MSMISDNDAIADMLIQLLANHMEGNIEFTKVDMYNTDTAPEEFAGGIMIFCKGEPMVLPVDVARTLVFKKLNGA